MSAPATEGVLGLLHEMTAMAMIESLKGQPIFDENGKEIGRTRPSPADLNVVAKFLKDNNITATREGSTALGKLEDSLKQTAPIADADDKELQAALADIIQFPGSVAHA